jgi:hypothetical protein
VAAKRLTPEEEKSILYTFHRVFGNEDGQRILNWLSTECMEKQTTFVVESDRASAFNEGKRSLILRIRAILEAPLA